MKATIPDMIMGNAVGLSVKSHCVRKDTLQELCQKDDCHVF